MSDELYQNLRSAEAAAKAVWPYAVALTEAEQNQQKCEELYAEAQKAYKKSSIVFIISLPGMVLFLLLSIFLLQQVSGFAWGMGFLFGMIAVIFAITLLSGIITMPINKYLCKKYTAQIADWKAQKNEAQHQQDRIVSQYREGLRLLRELMPEACMEPGHARVFVQYFETGRATTLQEAIGLFEEHVHRERMESLASQQLQRT